MRPPRYPGDPWLTPPPPRPGRLLLLGLPYAGMGASVFRGWEAALPGGVEMRGVRLPGRESRFGEAAIGSLDDLLPAIVEGLPSPLLEGPWSVYGHSMGALIAFELARLMTASGRPPVAVFVGAFRAPHKPDRYPPLYELPVDEFRAELRLRYGMLNEALDNPQIVEALEPTLRADSRVCDTYVFRPAPPLSCPLWVYGGTADDHIETHELEAWGEHTSGPFAVERIEGGHFFMTSAREDLLARISSRLDGLVP